MSDRNGGDGSILAIRLEFADHLYHVETADNSAEHAAISHMPMKESRDLHMLPGQMWRSLKSHEELRAVGVRSSVRHDQQSSPIHRTPWSFQSLVCERAPIYALSARSVSLCEVTSLNHEAFDDSVNGRVPVVQRNPRSGRRPLLARAQSSEAGE